MRWLAASVGSELDCRRGEINPEQVAIAADCLNMDRDVAKERAYDVRDGISAYLVVCHANS